MEELETVDDLLKLFQNLHDKGYGDMKLKCNDNYLHKDEIGIDYYNREIILRGYLFNYPPIRCKQNCFNS